MSSTTKDELRTKIAFTLQESGVYPYPEFVDPLVELFQSKINEARIEENKQALYVFENQVSDMYALYGALGGADKDLSKGIFVEHPEKGKVVLASDKINFKLPQFLKDRIAQLKKDTQS